MLRHLLQSAHRPGIWLALVVIALCSHVAVGQADEAAAPASATGAPASATAPFDADKARAAAQIRDPEAATRAYLDSVSPERRARTKSYARGNYVLRIVDFVFASALLVLLLALGISVRFRNLARRITRRRALQDALYWIQFYLALTVVQLPLTLYADYYREKDYGLLTQGLGGFLADQGKGLVIGCLLGAVLVMILYGVLRRAPRLWWVWGSAVVTAFLVFAIAIAPVVISPLFNKFTPVENVEIRGRILAMAHEQGIPADEVYQVDASRRTDRVSAYVNGMLGTMRIVMFDTTLKRCTPEEIQMIMGHEMGHYVLNHVWKSVAFFALLIVLGFLFVRWGFVRVVGRWPGLGLEGIADIAGLPLLALLFSVVVFVATPLVNTHIRREEAQADDFGLDASHQPDAAATTFLELGEYRDLDPGPIVEAIFFDHPSGEHRIRNAMEWKRAHAR
ncbi:MAG TPA: M48 family metallopeptidase [Kofleriaceae bacterium]|nr:M48 family metallopeptidase [Kofleriaceae bacterium]